MSFGIRITLPWPPGPERARPAWTSRPGGRRRPAPRRAELRAPRARAHRLHARPVAELSSAQAGTSWRQTIAGPVCRDELDHLAHVAPCRPGGTCCRDRGSRPGPASGSTVRDRARRHCGSAGVHAVVRPRARRRTRARGRRRRGRDLALPLRRPARARRLPARRALLSAVVAPLPALARAPAAEGRRAPRRRGLALAAPRRRAARAVARGAAGRRPPALPLRRRCSPRTTCCRGGRPTSESCGAACSRASTASSSTPSAAARRCATSASRRGSSRIPSTRAPPGRDDDGQTLLALGVIRPYKGLADAVEVVRRLPDARLLVAGDPAMPLDGLRDAPRTEWRLGYLRPPSFDRALSNATVAIFPYRAELDQSGALLQALGAGMPAVAYDVGGLAEPIARYGAGRVVPAGDVEALTEAARELLARPGRARGGARGRRAGAGRADVGRGGGEAPRALPGAGVIFRRSRWAELIRPPARPVRARAPRRDRGGARAARALQRRRPRRGRGAVRRLRRRGRDGHGAPRGHPRPLQVDARGGARRAVRARLQPRRRRSGCRRSRSRSRTAESASRGGLAPCRAGAPWAVVARATPSRAPAPPDALLGRVVAAVSQHPDKHDDQPDDRKREEHHTSTIARRSWLCAWPKGPCPGTVPDMALAGRRASRHRRVRPLLITVCAAGRHVRRCPSGTRLGTVPSRGSKGQSAPRRPSAG